MKQFILQRKARECDHKDRFCCVRMKGYDMMRVNFEDEKNADVF